MFIVQTAARSEGIALTDHGQSGEVSLKIISVQDLLPGRGAERQRGPLYGCVCGNVILQQVAGAEASSVRGSCQDVVHPHLVLRSSKDHNVVMLLVEIASYVQFQVKNVGVKVCLRDPTEHRVEEIIAAVGFELLQEQGTEITSFSDRGPKQWDGFDGGMYHASSRGTVRLWRPGTG